MTYTNMVDVAQSAPKSNASNLGACSSSNKKDERSNPPAIFQGRYRVGRANRGDGLTHSCHAVEPQACTRFASMDGSWEDQAMRAHTTRSTAPPSCRQEREWSLI